MCTVLSFGIPFHLMEVDVSTEGMQSNSEEASTYSS